MSNKTPLTADDLRDMARKIHECAHEYEVLAQEMEETSIQRFMATGLKTFRDKVIGGIQQNTRRLRVLLAIEISRNQGQLVAENRNEYVPDDMSAKKPTARSAKNRTGKLPDDNH